MKLEMVRRELFEDSLRKEGRSVFSLSFCDFWSESFDLWELSFRVSQKELSDVLMGGRSIGVGGSSGSSAGLDWNHQSKEGVASTSILSLLS
jgi:hypothetical protein